MRHILLYQSSVRKKHHLLCSVSMVSHTYPGPLLTVFRPPAIVSHCPSSFRVSLIEICPTWTRKVHIYDQGIECRKAPPTLFDHVYKICGRRPIGNVSLLSDLREPHLSHFCGGHQSQQIWLATPYRSGLYFWTSSNGQGNSLVSDRNSLLCLQNGCDFVLWKGSPCSFCNDQISSRDPDGTC